MAMNGVLYTPKISRNVASPSDADYCPTKDIPFGGASYPTAGGYSQRLVSPTIRV